MAAGKEAFGSIKPDEVVESRVQPLLSGDALDDEIQDKRFRSYSVPALKPVLSALVQEGATRQPPMQVLQRSETFPIPRGMPQTWRQQSLSHRRIAPSMASVEEEQIRFTLRVLNLDSGGSWGLVSWVSGIICLVVIPAFGYYFMQPIDTQPEHQLMFWKLVSLFQATLSALAFIFLHDMVQKHGLRAVLFLDSASEETLSVQHEYEKCLRQATSLLARVAAPAFALHLVQKGWLYAEVPLRISLAVPKCRTLALAGLFVVTSLSWVYQTCTFLFCCVIFWKVCTLQELKMSNYKELLRKRSDPGFCFREYSRIIQGLSLISHRFRTFLALAGLITLLGALASMYLMVHYGNRHVSFFNSGDLVVVNWVALMGAGLCLRSASRIAHLHRRIVKQACTVHALQTFDCVPPTPPTHHPQPDMENASDSAGSLAQWCLRQEAWAQRAALVNYLSNTTAGISVYGFVLDRAFVHTSLGGLLTTTWFILGRSLGA